MIEAINIHKRFGEEEILKGISAKFERGKTNLIIGQSGSGKTVFLKCLIGLFTPNKGEICFDGKSILKMDDLLKLIRIEYETQGALKIKILKRFLEILLLEILRLQQHQNAPLSQNIHYQRFLQFKRDVKKYYQSEKGVQFYADKQFITTKTLNLAVRQIVDNSAKGFINDYIILMAKRLLINTTSTSREVAYELGFTEPTNFTKFFKTNVKLSPLMFQKSCQ